MAGSATRRIGSRRGTTRSGRAVASAVIAVLAGVLVGTLLWLAASAPGLPPPVLTCASCVPDSVGLVEVNASEPAAGDFVILLAVDPTAGLTTTDFGVRLLSNGTAVPGGVNPGSCASAHGGPSVAFTPATCGPPTSGWYCVLLGDSGTTVAAVFNASGAWAPLDVPLADSQEIGLVSSSNLSGSGDVLAAYGTDATSVSGSVTL